MSLHGHRNVSKDGGEPGDLQDVLQQFEDRLAHACAKRYRAFCGWRQGARRRGRKRLHLDRGGVEMKACEEATSVSTALRPDSCFLGKPPPYTVTEFDLANTRVSFWEAMGYTPGLFLKEWVKC